MICPVCGNESMSGHACLKPNPGLTAKQQRDGEWLQAVAGVAKQRDQWREVAEELVNAVLRSQGVQIADEAVRGSAVQRFMKLAAYCPKPDSTKEKK